MVTAPLPRVSPTFSSIRIGGSASAMTMLRRSSTASPNIVTTSYFPGASVPMNTGTDQAVGMAAHGSGGGGATTSVIVAPLSEAAPCDGTQMLPAKPFTTAVSAVRESSEGGLNVMPLKLSAAALAASASSNAAR